MISDDLIAEHYAQLNLGQAIEAGLTTMGLSTAELTTADLAIVDEFHMGGRDATEHLLGQLDLTADMTVLDVGCGIGGAARHCAQAFGCSVAGVDLTPGYVEVAQLLTGWVGLSDQVTFHCANGADLPFKKRTIDAAFLLHVGMNVADKTGLFSSVAKVLRPGAKFGLYDLMRFTIGDLTYPMPWASSAATNFIATPDSYEASLTAAGFEVLHREDRTSAMLELMIAVAQPAKDGQDPPPLGLHLLMGPDADLKLLNVVEAMEAGILGPVEIVVAK